MKIAAVICEYDPFHRGHEEQLRLVRASLGDDTVLLSLMSGSTVERGRLAVYPKHLRAEAALCGGSDLVLELPAAFSSASAEAFAFGGVSLLQALSGIDYLVFGSESGDLSYLSDCASLLISSEFVEKMKQAPKDISYPRYAEIVAREYGVLLPSSSNDILAVQYLAALKRTASPIRPFTYRRKPGYSATEARKRIYQGAPLDGQLSTSAIACFSGLLPTAVLPYETVALHRLRETPTEELERYSYMNGGVAGLLKKAAQSESSLDRLLSVAGSRYTASRLRRAILSALLELTDDDRTAPPAYTSLLAANRRGCELLNSVKKTTSLSLLTKPSDYTALPPAAKKQFEQTLRADRLMSLCRGESPADIFKRSPLILD